MYPRIVHQGRRTYWEVAPGRFNATMSPDDKPKHDRGYASLEAIASLKGEWPIAVRNPHDVCQGCHGTGLIQWTSPPHRDDPNYAYQCSCQGTGKESVRLANS